MWKGRVQINSIDPGGRVGFRYTSYKSRWRCRVQVNSIYLGGRVGFRYTLDIQVEGFKNTLDTQVEGLRYTLDIHVEVYIYTQKKGYWGNFFKGLTLNKWELYPLQLTRYLTVCNSKCKDDPPPPHLSSF